MVAGVRAVGLLAVLAQAVTILLACFLAAAVGIVVLTHAVAVGLMGMIATALDAGALMAIGGSADELRSTNAERGDTEDQAETT
jgi:hypothetical protein